MSRVVIHEVKQSSPNRPYYILGWESDSGKEHGMFHGRTRSYKTKSGAEKGARELATKMRMNL